MIKKAKRLLPKFLIILAAFAIAILWLAIALTSLKKMVTYDYFGSMSFTVVCDFFFACIFAPLWEELAFRHAPMLIAKHFNKASKKVNLTWPVVIISSVIFGWGHGQGPISLLIQGVGGLLFSWVYLKNNYSYWSSVALHCLWNISLTYIFPAIVSTYGIQIIWQIK